MGKFIALTVGVMLFGITQLHSQNTTANNVAPNTQIIGVITNNPEDFFKVVDFLTYTKGIAVENYCYQHKLISFTFNKERFDELFSVFDLIQSHFTDAQCFDKNMSQEMYWKECGSEIVKQ